MRKSVIQLKNMFALNLTGKKQACEFQEIYLAKSNIILFVHCYKDDR